MSWRGIYTVKRTIQNWSSRRLFLSSGMKFAITITWRKARLIIMLVEVPKPLSIRELGTTSFKAVGVAQRITPEVKPRMNRPKQIT